jgi:hypothetical protein
MAATRAAAAEYAPPTRVRGSTPRRRAGRDPSRAADPGPDSLLLPVLSKILLKQACERAYGAPFLPCAVSSINISTTSSKRPVRPYTSRCREAPLPHSRVSRVIMPVQPALSTLLLSTDPCDVPSTTRVIRTSVLAPGRKALEADEHGLLVL